MKTLAILLGVLCTMTVSRAEEWQQRAELYFIDWDVLTRVALTPERVRELADHKRTFSRDVRSVVSALAISKLRPATRPEREDARLVVDLYTDTGARVTYYASRFNFCTADSKWKHPIDVHFRRYFSRLMKSRQRPNHAVERTTTRCAFVFCVTRTSPLRITHALGGRRSLCSR